MRLRYRLALAGVVPLALPLVALAGSEPTNASFESGLGGWTRAVGATNGRGGAETDIAIDADVAREGKASVRFEGGAGTTTWHMLTQPLDVTAGDRVSLRVAARCRGLVREGNQYANANGMLIFQDAAGQRVGFFTTSVLSGDREWVDLGLDVIAPAGAVRVDVGVFASMTGTTWFDDVRVTFAPATADTADGRAAAFDVLADHMRRTYPFWGLDGKPAPDALFGAHREKAVAAKGLAHFAGALRAMLAELDDVHVWIDTPAGRLGTAGPGPAPGFDVHAVLARLDARLVQGRNVLAGWIGEGDARVGYLLVGSLSLPQEERRLLAQALEALKDAPALIVDVRPNGGGDERLAQALMGRFADADVVYARSVWRDPTVAGLAGFGPPQDRVLTAAPAGQRYAGRVVVLGGPGCVSSTEGLLLMAKALPRVTVVGQPSRGASANPAAIELVPGLSVWVPRWRSLDLDGACIEGVGVPPDVAVRATAGQGDGGDAVLDRALELLRE